MTGDEIRAVPHPPVASREEWTTARKALLVKEKALTRQKDAVSAERRRLPMVKLAKEYAFDGPGGVRLRLIDLFGGRRQLIVYHFMFAPEWERGCMGCTGFVDSLGDLSLLGERDTAFALVSRAPVPKLEAYRESRGWNLPWYSSYGSDFNYDFHVSLDENVAPVVYNFEDRAEREARGKTGETTGESHGLSVFFRLGEEAYHANSIYGRGVESLTDGYALLDTTPYGRQEDFEDSPPGWPQRPTYG